MGSCPKAFRQVFHPRLQKCVHYQDPGIPEPCNKFFDQDSKLDKSYANSDLTHGQFLAQMVNFIRILRDIKSQNLEQFLFIKEETKNFFKKHGSKFPADETILKALEDLEIEVRTVVLYFTSHYLTFQHFLSASSSCSRFYIFVFSLVVLVVLVVWQFSQNGITLCLVA